MLIFLPVDEWRSKWHLSGQYADSSPDDLIKDMADIQAHVRLKAIATCAKAADYKPPTDEGIQLDYLDKDPEAEALPERLFVALECLLDDQVEKVRKAAAITLYSLSRPSEKVTKYRKIPKHLDTRKICCNHPKILTKWLYHRVTCPKDADRMETV